ncbi:MAG: thiamine pyrophosphate-dependent enzyme, partial [Pseudomonadota bacterium]
IRMKAYAESALAGAPATFKSVKANGKEFDGMKFTLQIAPEDCTGCGACAHNCPGKDKQNPDHKALDMTFQPPLRAAEAENFDFFLKLPDVDATQVKLETLRSNQLIRPLFEFSGACAGCGETPYLKLLTQLFGDRMMIANATGCSSIYGGNLPTTPYAQRADGRGPAWSNSLFEDNAEFGYGMRLTVDQFSKSALEYVAELADNKAFAANAKLLKEIASADQSTQAGIEAQRGRVDKLKAALKGSKNATAKLLVPVVDYLVKKSVWCIGGDGWAYDIGFGGLDHVIASGKNINLFVLDTEVYSNTGGQASKATPMGAVGLFAAGGKPVSKKDLGMIAMSYGSVYVAQVALSNPNQCIKAMLEAEAYDGPSIIIAYSHCIAHGINMTAGVDAQKMAVQSGYWPLYRYNPALAAECKNPLQLDSKPATISFEEYTNNENRYRMLKKANPKQAEALMKKAGEWAKTHFAYYQKLAALNFEDTCEKK